MLPSYFDYIFVHLKDKKHVLGPNFKREIFVNFRPEPDPKRLARLTTLNYTSEKAELKDLQNNHNKKIAKFSTLFVCNTEYSYTCDI